MVLSKLSDFLGNAFKSKSDLDLLEGPVGKNLFYLALPVVVTNLLRTAYNIADTFWLGQYSGDALAAITFAFPLVFFLISLGMGLAVAGSVLIAQYEGKGSRSKVDFAASQTVTFSAAVSIVLGAAGYFLMGDVLTLLGAEGAVAASASGYLQIISLGLFAMFGFAVFMSMMRGFGDTLTPMLLMLATVILNIVIDPFFIFGWWIFPEMGVEGAAVATIFSRFLSLGVALWILFSGRKGVKVELGKMKPDPDYFRKMVKIGVPASIEGVGRSVSVNLLVAVIGWMFIDQVVAGYGIGIRIFSMIFLPAVAVGRAVESMSGQNLGAGNFERAGKTARAGAKYSLLILSGIGVLTFIFADPIASVFTKDQAIASIAAEFLTYISLTFGGVGVLRAFSGLFRGAGKTIVAAFLAVASLGLIRLPVAYIAANMVGLRGIWAGFIASNILGAVIAYLLYRRGGWRKTVTEEDQQRGEIAEEADEYGETITEALNKRKEKLFSGFTGLLDFRDS